MIIYPNQFEKRRKKKVEGYLNPGLFNRELFIPRLFNHEFLNHRVEKNMVENSRVEKFMVEKSGVERLKGWGLKLGVEKSRVEMSFNRLFYVFMNKN